MRPQQLKLFILQEKRWQKLLIWGRVLDQNQKFRKYPKNPEKSQKILTNLPSEIFTSFYRIPKMSIPKFGILDQFLGLFSKLASFRISGFSSGFSGFFQDSFVVLWDFSGFHEIPMNALKFLEIPRNSSRFLGNVYLSFIFLLFYRPTIIEKLMESFSTIRSAKISRSSLWILGEYCEKPTDIQAVMNEIRQSLGEIPIVEDELRKVLFIFF